jgi:hypothetical protein
MLDRLLRGSMLGDEVLWQKLLWSIALQGCTLYQNVFQSYSFKHLFLA